MNYYIDSFYAKREDDTYVHTSSHTHDGVRYGDLESDSLYNVVKTKLYEGACLSKLSMTLLLINLKTKYGWSDTSLIALLKYVILLFLNI